MNIPYAKHEITESDIAAVSKAMKSGYLTGGEQVLEFEENFKKYVNAEYALAVSSGTAALHLAVIAMKVPSEKTVLMPSLTFAATANSVLYCGANVEFVDIDPDTFLIDLNIVKQKIELNPKKYAGVIVVDYAGYPVDTKSLRSICNQYNLWIIEDAAHAPGAISARDEDIVHVGSSSYADITVFSFHPAKHITTGEGGMITTRRKELYDIMKLLRSHAMSKENQKSQDEGWYYSIEQLGYNYRMSELNAALGVSQLKRAAQNLERRREIASIYDSELAQTNIKLPVKDEKNTHAYHLYIIQSTNRRQLYDQLKLKGIFSQVHYVPLHMQQYYKDFDGTNDLPHTDDYYKFCLSIPMYPSLTKQEQDYVIQTIEQFSSSYL